MTELLLDVPDVGVLPAYFSAARVDDDAPAPGVVVVHELFGVTDDIRRIADEFAARGFHAVAPDLLSHGATVRCLVSLVRALGSGEGRPFAELDAARTWIADRDDCTGQVGIAGFCLGGAFALVMANRGFGASAVQYGQLPKNLDAAMQGACPVVASYGGLDRTLRGAADSLTGALERAGVEHDVQEYADAGHSFMNHSGVPSWMAPFTRLMHAGYVDTAATDAWDRITAMFDAALRPTVEGPSSG
jgi:carboxymethylenebutenolidase